MDDEEDGDGIQVGDVVWWQRGEGVLGMYDLSAGPKDSKMIRTLRVGSSVLCGRVRAVTFEEPDFSYAVIAAYPDGRLIQVPLHWLSKEMPPDRDPISEESPEMALP